MKKRGNALALATILLFAACGNQANTSPATNEVAQTETTEPAATEEVVEETPEAEDAPETEVEEDAEETPAEEEATEEKNEEDKEATSPEEVTDANIVIHRAYPAEADTRSFANIVVATSGDKIVAALIDEYQFFDADSNYKPVPNSDGAFGEGTVEGKVLGSKVDNNEAYSADMKAAGGEITLLDNYNAVTDFATGKTIAELEEFLSSTPGDEMLDAISGATFHSSPSLLQMIVDTAKDNTFLSYGNATNPDDVKLRYALGAPHGDKSFGNAVVVVEGDIIIAASIDEYQYLEGGKGVPSSDKGFGESYADSKVVLGSKLQNDDMYSKLMADIAGSEVSIADNFRAIENFVAGKTIDEVKEVIASANPGEAIDAVSGATLVDTAGYLQLIVDAAENNIRVQ